MPTPEDRYGFGYRQTTLYQESESVSPLAEVRVKDLLPHVAVETNNG